MDQKTCKGQDKDFDKQTRDAAIDRETLPESLQIYTLQETAQILSVTERSIHRFIKDGRLQASKIGREWRIPKKSIEDFIQAGMTLTDALCKEQEQEQSYIPMRRTK